SAVVAAALLASPTVHPWYVTWLAALLPFAPATARRAFTLFVAVAPVAYVSAWGLARTGEWSEPGWLWWVSWGAPLSVLAWDRVRGAASREGSG
ncbi:MAG TPA: hypothetical protein VKU85_12155, partial [bacterium]|nr:hypothetical protein [bacterium]